MKLTNVGLIVCMIFLCFAAIDDVRTRELQTVSELQIKMNQILDNAAADAVIRLVETDSGRDRVINKSEAVRMFFTSAYMNLDIMEKTDLKKQFNAYIPVIAVVDDDGFYIYYNQEIVEEELLWKPAFTDKYLYTKVYGEFRVDYTLQDYITVTELKSGQVLEGNYHDIRPYCAALSHLMQEEAFERERRQVITELLMDKISWFISEHNKIAARFGIQYQFMLPRIEKEEWYRTIDDIGIIVFFQGYPYGGRERGYFNRVLIGGARVRKDA